MEEARRACFGRGSQHDHDVSTTQTNYNWRYTNDQETEQQQQKKRKSKRTATTLRGDKNKSFSVCLGRNTLRRCELRRVGPVSEQQLSGGRVQRERTRREEEEVLTVGRGGGGLSRDAVGATRRAKGGVYRRGERVLDVHTARRAEANTSGCRLNVAPMHQRCRLVAPWRPHPIAVVVSPSYLPPPPPPKKKKRPVSAVELRS